MGQKETKLKSTKQCRAIAFIYNRWKESWKVSFSKDENNFLTNNTFNQYSEIANKRQVLLLAHFGIAALNIDGATIHVGLGINPNCNSYTISKQTTALNAKLKFESQRYIQYPILDYYKFISNCVNYLVVWRQFLLQERQSFLLQICSNYHQ